ncbi:MAG: hypothetical protein IKS62_03055 [Aeriscardovia sp.]|nr:hypothetical protein [Aeriscardovia sp.]MBR6434564.1 hypothetical protein [Aeriscardovia sp.]
MTLRHLARRTGALLSCAGLCVALCCCAAPSGAWADDVPSSSNVSAGCEAALDAIVRETAAENAVDAPAIRFLVYQDAANSWLSAAADCPGRYEQGIVESAYASYEAHAIATAAGISPSAVETGADVDAVDKTSPDTSSDVVVASVPTPEGLGTAATSALALAQDKAAFSMEVLAARSNPINEQDYALSLRARGNAAQLADGLTKDPRQKLYSVQTLLAHPDTLVDPSTGLRTPTNAAVEMELGLSEAQGTSDLATARQRLAAAAFVREAFYDAWTLGYPAAPLPLES